MQTLLDNNDLILLEAAIVEPIRRAELLELDPLIVHAGLIYDKTGRTELRRLYLQYAMIARKAKLPFLMCTPTWRTNSERVRMSGADPDINRRAAQFVLGIREELRDAAIKVGGLIGCKNDCYRPTESLSANQAEEFHVWQINELASSNVDFLVAVTLPSVGEAEGLARAMSSTDKPYFVSFVINKSGDLLDGSSLTAAIDKIDDSVGRPPLGYMINCAHPKFLCAEKQPERLFDRLLGFQANASSLDHDQLDGAKDVQMDDLDSWCDKMISLHSNHGIKILGGCCGTNAAHLQCIVEKTQHVECDP